MTAADRQRAVERIRAAAKGKPAEPVEDDPQVPASRLGDYVRTDPVRSTVDLSPAHHAALAAWADELSVELGRPPGRRGVSRQAVLAALVAELLADETMARRVRKRLAQEYGRQES